MKWTEKVSDVCKLNEILTRNLKIRSSERNTGIKTFYLVLKVWSWNKRIYYMFYDFNVWCGRYRGGITTVPSSVGDSTRDRRQLLTNGVPFLPLTQDRLWPRRKVTKPLHPTCHLRSWLTDGFEGFLILLTK